MAPALIAILLTALAGAASAQTADRSGGWRDGLAHPAREFTQVPFWFWNDALDDGEIRRQMADFRDHGVYGFVIHARMGLPADIPYMGQRWLGHVRAAIEEAGRTGMRVCLYDEGMYPSGSAHGEVVRSNPAFAAQGLVVAHADVEGPVTAEPPVIAGGTRLAVVAVKLADGKDTLELGSSRVLDAGSGTAALPEGRWRLMTFARVPTGGRIRGVHEGEDDGQPGAPLAADLLNPDAVRAFLELTHKIYYGTFGEHFGKTVFAFFTDEPSLQGRGARPGLKPWTQGLEQFFRKRRGYDLLPRLPALFFDAGEQTEQVRADFARTVSERLDEAYYRQLSEWCERHGVALTGHPAGNEDIGPLRRFQIPGQDIVWRSILPGARDALEGPLSVLGKSTSSVATHDRRRRNANEVYGAYGWQLTFDEMKWLADWLMVRGVNLLYPHAFYYSVRDTRRDERPPDVGPNNTWWGRYGQFADYTARICGLLTGSRQVCDVAVLCSADSVPWRAAKYLFQNQIDFNYVEDWRLTEQARIRARRFEIAGMKYSTLIVDRDGPLSGEAARRVREFEEAGGRVRYCRTRASEAMAEGIRRDVVLREPAEDLRSMHVSREGVEFYLLVNEGEQTIDTTLTCRSRGRAEWFDAWSGRFEPCETLRADRDGISVRLRLEKHESRVLCVERG